MFDFKKWIMYTFMAHPSGWDMKVYIIPILLDDAAYRDHFHQT